ncbi:MAG: NifB/NifX family molybdenum-iron cluster-binding protein [Candidatus Margulisbacteria bacterium]|nr:NifB/NifX family molybdenum-iron cluster-binding protein [Candidatus Margulisiibacteriota bacterium]MBU1616311.1 NifB/NifX family molybdenum-iron cluster-binding protein [Candidatus Margulisiibacteriota bacterium]
MKICVTANGDNLDAAVDQRFGRSPYFIVVDPESLGFKAIANPNVEASGGAGIQSAQLIASEGAAVVATGNVGPNAYQTLSALKVKVLTGVTGTVNQAIADFKAGKLKEQTGPSVSGHFGQGESQ